MSKEGPKDPGRRKFIKTGLIASVSVATGIGLSELAKRFLEPKMSPDEFTKNFDQIFSLLPIFEGTKIPYAAGYEDWKVYEFKFEKFYKLSNIKGERSLAISDERISLFDSGNNHMQIYKISPSQITKTFDGINSGSTPTIAELLSEKEVLLLSFEVQGAFLEWAKTAPKKSPNIPAPRSTVV